MIKEGVDSFIEFGHGQVLNNLIKRIDPTVMLYNIGDENTESQIERVLNLYNIKAPPN
jgi:[acyl-carrier-protein] S-malonyltransferase